MTVQFNMKTGSRGIEWCDETRNAIGGCTHECRWFVAGVEVQCYAKSLAEKGVAKKAYPRGFEHHYFRPAALKLLAAGDEPLLIFVDSMSDMFAANVPEEDVTSMLSAMHSAPHHSYLSLTKAAPQIIKYLDRMPRNLWVGVSSPPDHFRGKYLAVGQQKAMLRRALDVLRIVKEQTGNVVWMSAEPISWDLTSVINNDHPLDWIVMGAASHGRRYYQPEAGHLRGLLDVMDATETPVFYKGNLRPTFANADFGSAELNRWREDFPTHFRGGEAIPAVARRQHMCGLHGWTKIKPSGGTGPQPADGLRLASTAEER